MEVSIDIDPADIGMIIVALRDSAERAAHNRDILAGAGDGWGDVIARADRRIVVLTAAADQIAAGYVSGLIDQMLARGLA